MAESIQRPDWWSYPERCPHGYEWGPFRVIVGWMPCDCPGAMRHPGRGHLYVKCGEKGCTATWYKPRHAYGLGSPGPGRVVPCLL
jgi:hypothetical protein